MKDIVIVGKGGFAREIKYLIDSINQSTEEWRFLGYIDKKIDADDVIGDDNFIVNRKKQLFVSIAIGNPKLRYEIYKKYRKNDNIEFPNLISPSVYISESICLGEGNIICANNVLTVDILLGSFNIINLSCTVGHDVKMGNFNTINPGTNISGNVILNDFIEIGTGTKVIQGITIQHEVIIGAGAVVIKDIPRNTTVVGVPAAVIKNNQGEEKDG